MSVLIITYNHEKYIREAIEGCLNQKTDFKYEIIVHDDASTDGTTDIVREYAMKFPDIIYPIIQTENQYSKGVKITPTIVIPKTKGKYIAFCEGDDYWCDTQKLQQQVDIMENDPEISMCFHANKQLFLGNSNIVERYYHVGNCFFNNSHVISLGGRFYHIATCLVRKDIFYSIPNWFFLASVGDIPLALLAGAKGKLYYLNKIMSVHRLGVSESWSDRIRKNPEYFLEYVEKYRQMLIGFNEDARFLYDKEIKINLSGKYRIYLKRFDVSHKKKIKFIKEKSSQMTNFDKFLSYFYLFSKYPEIRYHIGIIKRFLGKKIKNSSVFINTLNKKKFLDSLSSKFRLY